VVQVTTPPKEARNKLQRKESSKTDFEFRKENKVKILKFGEAEHNAI